MFGITVINKTKNSNNSSDSDPIRLEAFFPINRLLIINLLLEFLFFSCESQLSLTIRISFKKKKILTVLLSFKSTP